MTAPNPCVFAAVTLPFRIGSRDEIATIRLPALGEALFVGGMGDAGVVLIYALELSNVSFPVGDVGVEEPGCAVFESADRHDPSALLVK